MCNEQGTRGNRPKLANRYPGAHFWTVHITIQHALLLLVEIHWQQPSYHTDHIYLNDINLGQRITKPNALQMMKVVCVSVNFHGSHHITQFNTEL